MSQAFGSDDLIIGHGYVVYDALNGIYFTSNDGLYKTKEEADKRAKIINSLRNYKVVVLPVKIVPGIK